MPLLKWKTLRQRYSDIERGYLGSICVFEIFYNGCRCHGETGNSYVLAPRLPGFEERYYGDEESELEERAGSMLKEWLEKTGLTVKA